MAVGDPTSITVDAGTQLEGEVPNTNLSLATSTTPGAVQPDNTSLKVTAGVISGNGLTCTIVTAQLTTLGSQGSMTFQDGVLTGKVDAT